MSVPLLIVFVENIGVVEMSENNPGWFSMRTIADMLTTADNVSSIEFYVSKRDNSPAELNCRCFGLPSMSKANVEAFAAELNAAIAPVKKAIESKLQSQSANQLRRFL